MKRKKAWKATPHRTKAQSLWSKIVRTRDKFTCQWCGSTEKEKMQAAHIFGKKASPAIRYNIHNGVCLCWSCHYKADQMHRHQFTLFCMDHLGKEMFDTLLGLSSQKMGSWGPVEYERDMKYLSDKAVELGLQDILE